MNYFSSFLIDINYDISAIFIIPHHGENRFSVEVNANIFMYRFNDAGYYFWQLSMQCLDIAGKKGQGNIYCAIFPYSR